MRWFAAAVGLLLLTSAQSASACLQSAIIFFDPGSIVPREEGVARLQSFAGQLLGRQDLRAVMIVGHSDRTGSVRARAKTALDRAEAVRVQLIAFGLPERLLRTSGAADEKPLRPTADHVPEPLNRRVELSVHFTAESLGGDEALRRSSPNGVPIC